MPDIGRVLGYGRTAEIFLWGNDQIIKLFHEDWLVRLVEEEARIGKVLHETGLPVPAVEGIRDLNGRKGIVYERIEGKTMLQEFSSKPWTVLRLTRIFTELHLAIHEQSITNLPSQRERISGKIQESSAVSTEMRKAALGILRELPDDDVLCHGDYHPDQVIMSPRGPVIIDWSTATHGNPIADVANTSLLLGLAEPATGRISRILTTARKFVRNRYRKRYLKRTLTSKKLLDSWELPVVVARLSDDIPEERQRLLKLIERLVK